MCVAGSDIRYLRNRFSGCAAAMRIPLRPTTGCAASDLYLYRSLCVQCIVFHCRHGIGYIFLAKSCNLMVVFFLKKIKVL